MSAAFVYSDYLLKMWGLLNYLVVALAEEIYFRDLFYRVIEGRTSGRVAVLVPGLLFGLVHFRQGLGMLPRYDVLETKRLKCKD